MKTKINYFTSAYDVCPNKWQKIKEKHELRNSVENKRSGDLRDQEIFRDQRFERSDHFFSIAISILWKHFSQKGWLCLITIFHHFLSKCVSAKICKPFYIIEKMFFYIQKQHTWLTENRKWTSIKNVYIQNLKLLGF